MILSCLDCEISLVDPGWAEHTCSDRVELSSVEVWRDDFSGEVMSRVGPELSSPAAPETETSGPDDTFFIESASVPSSRVRLGVGSRGIESRDPAGCGGDDEVGVEAFKTLGFEQPKLLDAGGAPMIGSPRFSCLTDVPESGRSGRSGWTLWSSWTSSVFPWLFIIDLRRGFERNSWIVVSSFSSSCFLWLGRIAWLSKLDA